MNEYIRGFVLVYLGLIVLAEVWKRIRSYFYTYKNKHYFITGGSEGLGRSLARLIALKGGKVTIAARHMEKLKQVKNEIEDEFKKKKKGDCHVCAIQCDVIDESSVHQAVVKSIRQQGEIDVFISCAGYAETGYSMFIFKEEIDICLEWERSCSTR